MLNHPLRARVVLQANQGDEFSVCAPVITELVFGLLELERSKQNLQTWAALETTLTLLPLMPEDAHAAAELRHVLRRKGHQLLTIDAQIAAIALRNGLTLLTTDSDFSMIPALSTESWV